MIITKEWAKENRACADGIVFAEKHNLFGKEHLDVILELMELGQTLYAVWLECKTHIYTNITEGERAVLKERYEEFKMGDSEINYKKVIQTLKELRDGDV